MQGQYAEAEAVYLRAIGIQEKALGSDDPEVAATLNNLAGLFQTQVRAVSFPCLWLVKSWLQRGRANVRGRVLKQLFAKHVVVIAGLS